MVSDRRFFRPGRTLLSGSQIPPPTSAVTITAAAIPAAGATLTVTFSAPVTGSGSGFTLSASGGAATLAYTGGSGTATLAFTISRKILIGETVTLTYLPGNLTDGTLPLPPIVAAPVTNNSTETGLSLVTMTSATIPAAGNSLSIVFSAPVTGSSGFTVAASGGSATLNYTGGSGTNTLTFATDRVIYQGETVTVTYAPGDVVDGGALPLPGMSRAVTNNSTAINYSSVTLTSGVIPSPGTSLVLTYSSAVTLTNAAGFTASASGGPVTLTYNAGSGSSTPSFTLSRTIYQGETFTLSYSPASGNVTDGARPLPAFSNRSITNNSTQINYSAVTINTATIPAAGNTMTVVFSAPVGGANGFTISASGGPATVAYGGGDGTNTYTLTINRVIYAGEVVTLTYTPGNLSDGSKPLPPIPNKPVTNNSTTVNYSSVGLNTATVTSTGATLALTFSAPVTNSNGFTLAASGGPVTLTYSAGSGTSILTFNTSRTVYQGETTSVSYAPGNVTDGTLPIAPIVSFPATNNSTVINYSTVTIQSAAIPAAGNTLSLVFTAPVTNSNGFTISCSGGPAAITYTGGSTTATLSFSINRTIYQGEAITVSYIPGNVTDGTKPIASFTSSPVTNNSTAINYSTVVLNSASINAAGTSLSAGFSAPVTNSTGFTIAASGGACTLTYTGGSGSANLAFSTSRIIHVGEVVTITYAPGNVVDGGLKPLAPFSNQAVANNSTAIDYSTVTLNSATIPAAGNSITLAFSAPVTNSTGFSLAASGGAAGLTYTSGSGTANLTFAINRSILSSETATVTYTPGNVTDGTKPLPPISAFGVTNNSTQTGLSLVTISAATIPTAGTSLSVTFSAPVYGSTGFTLAASGGAATITYTGGSGTATLTFSISRTIYQGETATVNYTPGNFTDGTLPLPALSKAVTNNSTAVNYSTVTINAATINAAGSQLAIGFTAAVTNSNGFTVTASAGPAVLTNTGGTGTNQLTFSIDRPLYQGETVTVTYTPGNVVDGGAKPLPPISNYPATNNSTVINYSSVTIQSAVVNPAGTTLTLGFSAPVTNSNGFTIAAASGAATITNSGGSGTNTLTFTINRTIYQAEAVTVSYAPGNVTDGTKPLAPFSAYAVTNNSTVIHYSNVTINSAVINTAGTTLSVTFSAAVTGNTVFAITPSGGAATMTYTSGSGSATLLFTLSRTIYSGETATIAYTPGNHSDGALPLPPVASYAVTNNSTALQQSPVTLNTVTIPATGNTITLVFSAAVFNSTGFTITPSQGAALLTYTGGSGTASLVFAIGRTIMAGETVTLSYVPGNVNDGTLPLAPITNRAVTNNSTSFNPNSLAPGLWIRADNGLLDGGGAAATIDGTPIRTWQDKSGNSRHLIPWPDTEPCRPIMKLAQQNGLPVLRFDGVDDRISVAYTNAAVFTRVSVFKATLPGNDCWIFGGIASAGVLYGVGPTAGQLTMYSGAVGPLATGLSGKTHVISEVFNGATSKLYVNGTLIDTRAAGSDLPGGLVLSTGPAFPVADYCEVFQKDGVMADVDRQSVEQYLNKKWRVFSDVTITAAAINTAGTTLTLTFSAVVTGDTGFAISASGGAASLTYSSGSGTISLAFTISRTIMAGEVVTLTYLPGNAIDVSALPIPPIIAYPIVNNSTAFDPLTLNPQIWIKGDVGPMTSEGVSFTAGSNQRLVCTGNPAIEVGNLDFWCAGWFYKQTAPADYMYLMGKWQNASRGQYQVTINGSNLIMFVDSGTVLDSIGTPYSPATWNFFFGYHDAAANVYHISANGGAGNTKAWTAGVPATNQNLVLGGSVYGSYFLTGQMDACAFGKNPPGGITSIAATIKAQLYNGGIGRNYYELTAQQKIDWGLQAYYDLNEGSSSSRIDSHGTNHLGDVNGCPITSGYVPREANYDTANIVRWADQSGFNRHLGQGTATRRPVLKLNYLNGKSVVRFDGVDDFIQSITVNFAQPNTVFIVLASRATSPAIQYPLSGIGDYGNALTLSNGNTLGMIAGGSGPATNMFGLNAFQCISAEYNGTTSRLFRNGVQEGAATTTGTQAFNGLLLGCLFNGSYPASVDIAEYLVFDELLSDANRIKVEQYLKTKWATP